MNLHLQLHLQESFLEFGPAPAFWTYPFERYNGILGSFSTNNKAIEVQLMKKFITNQSVQAITNLADPKLISLLPVPSFDTSVFSISSVVSDSLKLHRLYTQLYSNYQIQHVSPFFEKCGRINLAGDLIRSVLSGASARSSSVIMSYSRPILDSCCILYPLPQLLSCY